jgi:PTS system nitrogen regulatory IIA component
MTLDELIPETHVFHRVRVPDKTALLAELGRRAGGLLGLAPAAITAALAAREALGSTGTGHGLAVPHARLDEISATTGFLARLDRPIAFDAVDAAPVDLVFLLLSPTSGGNHLQALAAVSRRLRERTLADAARQAGSAAELRALLLKEPAGANLNESNKP